MTYTGHPHQKFGHTTYSQHGEDMMLLNLCEFMGIKIYRNENDPPLWLDLGAYHPTGISNTALLYTYGGHGVNVDANPELVELFKKERLRDVNLHAAVGDRDEFEVPFYVFFSNGATNTVSKDEAERLEKKYPLKSVDMVPMVSVNTIVQKHCKGTWPEILLCDIEGYDLAVMKAANFENSKPKMIIVETNTIEDMVAMTEVLEKKDFKRYCRMGWNLIFIDDGYAWPV